MFVAFMLAKYIEALYAMMHFKYFSLALLLEERKTCSDACNDAS